MAADGTAGCMGGGGGGGGGWTGVCVLGDGGGVGRLNLSGLLLLRGEGLCGDNKNGRSAWAHSWLPGQPNLGLRLINTNQKR